MKEADEAMAVLELVGHNIAKQRKVAGLTQTELAMRSKVSRATIAAIENGAADPKLSTIIAICAGISQGAFTQVLQDMWVSELKQHESNIRLPDTSETPESGVATGGSVVGLAAGQSAAIATAIALGAAGGPIGLAIGGLLGALLSGSSKSEDR